MNNSKSPARQAVIDNRNKYHLMGKNKCCSWRVARPCQATNLVKRPSFESWTFGPTASTVSTANMDIIPTNGTVESSTKAAHTGIQSLRCVSTGLLPFGARLRFNELTASTLYTFSAYVYSDSKKARSISFQAIGSSTGSLNYINHYMQPGWNYVSIAFFTDATPSTDIVITSNRIIASDSFFVDSVMIVAGKGHFIYFDGDRGGSWIGTPNDSYSTRDIYTPGGELVDLCELGFYPLAFGNIGLPELDLGEREYALRGGAISDRTLVRTRAFTMLGRVYGDQNEIHKVRQKLLELFTPSNSQQRTVPTLMRYQIIDDCCNKFGCELEVIASFEGEAAFTLDNFDGVDIGFKFKELEAPNIYEIGYREKELLYRNDDGGSPPATVSDYFIKQATGGWVVRSEVVFSSVTRATAVIPSPTVVGDAWFGSQGNSPNVFTAGINSAANFPGSGVIAMTDVYDIAQAANGKTWFTGTGSATLWYRDAAGTTTDRSASFTTPTNVAISQNFIYVGATNQTGGIVRRSANDGASWVSLSAVSTGTVKKMAVQPDGKVVVVGSFTQTTNINKTAVNAMRYNPKTFAWEAICTSADATIDAVAVGPDGKVYLGGKFTTLNGVAVNQVAVWNGTQISALGSGVGAPATFDAADSKSIKAIAVAADGTVWVGGRFDTAGGNAAVNLAKWQGGAWQPSDLAFTNRPVQDLAIDKAGNLFVAATVSGGADVPDTDGINDICYYGSADEKPVFTITGPGTLKSIKHLVTGNKIEFDYTIADGEVMTLDLGRNDSSIFTSNINGNQLRAIRTSSNTGTFALIATPAECENCPNNTIAVLIEGGTTGTTKCVMRWRNRHWTLDAAATCGRDDDGAFV